VGGGGGPDGGGIGYLVIAFGDDERQRMDRTVEKWLATGQGFLNCLYLWGKLRDFSSLGSRRSIYDLFLALKMHNRVSFVQHE